MRNRCVQFKKPSIAVLPMNFIKYLLRQGTVGLLTIGILWSMPRQTMAQSSDAEAQRILEEVERRQEAVKNESATIHMQIVDAKGRTRSRTMQVRTKVDAEGIAKSMLRFSDPGDIRGLGLLTI
jgi:2,4-dienoyl-CoA reductase-like NADH-dependent reductase (Old Yellow Enzyme family)